MRNNRLRVIVFLLMAAVVWSGAEARAGHVFKDGKWVRTPEPVEGTAAGEIEMIRRLLEGRKHSKAIKASDKFLKKYPDNPLCEDAMMLAGQAEFDRGRYYQAFERFENQLGRFPAGKLAERALDREYRVGAAFLEGKKRIVGKVFRLSAIDTGIEILTRVAEHAPGTLLAEKALLRIPDYYFQKQKYTEAAERYDEFLEIFPKSKKAPYAALRAGRAAYAIYKGPKFDDTPLLEAQQRFKRFGELYPQAAKRENIPQLLKRIEEQQAERLFVTAEFYVRTSRARAARFYYRRVISRYSKTAWADMARESLQRIDRAQARPARKGWLDRLLPGRRKQDKPSAAKPAPAAKPGRTEK